MMESPALLRTYCIACCQRGAAQHGRAISNTAISKTACRNALHVPLVPPQCHVQERVLRLQPTRSNLHCSVLFVSWLLLLFVLPCVCLRGNPRPRHRDHAQLRPGDHVLAVGRDGRLSFEVRGLCLQLACPRGCATCARSGLPNTPCRLALQARIAAEVAHSTWGLHTLGKDSFQGKTVGATAPRSLQEVYLISHRDPAATALYHTVEALDASGGTHKMQLSAIHYLPTAQDTTGACAALAAAGGADAQALRDWSFAALVRRRSGLDTGAEHCIGRWAAAGAW